MSQPPRGPSFRDFHFPEPIDQSLEKMGFTHATEVQSQAIPLVLAGKDILATAQTGTGKTAAFALPLLARLIENPSGRGRVLIIAPVRELAEQIGEVLRDLTQSSRRFSFSVIIGGAPYARQLRELKNEPSFIVGTPGRLIDHIKGGHLNLANFGTLVLDEADRMLDMGFEPQIEQIIREFPQVRQTLMFTATLPPEVKRLVARYLKSPARIAIGADNKPIALIQQDMIEVRDEQKDQMLIDEIDKVAGTILVFTRTKIRADQVSAILNVAGHQAEALHGDLNQGQRKRVVDRFRNEKIRILVATDIAARGLDIDHIRHVINFDLPLLAEDYIHRIGRTGRAGREGHSIAFVSPREKYLWYRILELMGKPAPGKSEKRGPQGDRASAKKPNPPPRQSPFARPSRPAAKPSKSPNGDAKFVKNPFGSPGKPGKPGKRNDVPAPDKRGPKKSKTG